MFKLSDAYKESLSVEEILDRINILDLWRYYCTNFKRLDESFLSELYKDRNASCRIFQSNNTLLYKDFGNGSVYNIFQYIQAKYRCTFKESLIIICNDFKLMDISYPIVKDHNIKLDESLMFKPKTQIRISPQKYSIIDYKYWSQYYLDFKILEEYDVFACEKVYLHKGEDTIVFNYKPNNPIYAYRFVDNGFYYYKIYFPLADKKYKWLFSGNSNIIEGFDQLELFGDVLIITKSLKDVMVYRLFGYNAISLQGENNKLKTELVEKLLKRYDTIMINYDNDEAGIKGTNRLINQFGFKHFYIDKHKDISDYIKHEGYIKTKQMIDDKIKQLQ